MVDTEQNFDGNVNRLVKNSIEKLIFKCPYDE